MVGLYSNYYRTKSKYNCSDSSAKINLQATLEEFKKQWMQRLPLHSFEAFLNTIFESPFTNNVVHFKVVMYFANSA